MSVPWGRCPTNTTKRKFVKVEIGPSSSALSLQDFTVDVLLHRLVVVTSAMGEGKWKQARWDKVLPDFSYANF